MPIIYRNTEPITVTQERYDQLITRHGYYAQPTNAQENSLNVGRPLNNSRMENAVIGLGAKPAATVKSEAGTGAIVPWAGALWVETYLANTNSAYGLAGANGSGTGLWRIDSDGNATLVGQNDGCHPAHLVHKETGYLLIGNHIVTQEGRVVPIYKFTQAGNSPTERITGYARHLSAPTTKVYVFTMGGLFFEMDLSNLETLATSNNGITFLNNAATVLGMTAATVHGKAIWTATGAGRTYAVFNNNPSSAGNADGGRLASWNGTTWTTQDTGNNSWINVSGSYMGHQHVWATGHDDLSVLLWMFNGETATAPRKFRLPFGHEGYKHYFQQEWMRCRAVDTERYLLDAHGMFYSLSPYLTDTDTFATSMPRMEAIAKHYRTIPDFASYQGNLVLGSNQASNQYGQFPNVGDSQSGLWFTQTDNLWRMGKPAGVGYWWKGTSVSAAQESLPMLARGFDRKTVNLYNASGSTATNVDIITYHETTGYTITTVAVAASTYAHYEFPTGYQCDWITVKSSAAVTLSAWVAYN